jgi:hypothetical protein
MTLISKLIIGLIGELRFQYLRHTHFYAFAIEAFAMNTFSLAVAIPNELLIARMDIGTHIKTRLLAAIMNTLVGRIYGLWRDRVMIVVADKSSFHRRYFADTAAFAIFQLPLYWFNMAVGGRASFREMLAASIVVTLLAGLLGRPYGVYLEFLRRQFGIGIIQVPKPRNASQYNEV